MEKEKIKFKNVNNITDPKFIQYFVWLINVNYLESVSINFEKFIDNRGDYFGTLFDYVLIMHYDEKAFINNWLTIFQRYLAFYYESIRNFLIP